MASETAVKYFEGYVAFPDGEGRVCNEQREVVTRLDIESLSIGATDLIAQIQTASAGLEDVSISFSGGVTIWSEEEGSDGELDSVELTVTGYRALTPEETELLGRHIDGQHARADARRRQEEADRRSYAASQQPRIGRHHAR